MTVNLENYDFSNPNRQWAEEKYCDRCRVWKRRPEYPKIRGKGTGGGSRNTCWDCVRATRKADYPGQADQS